MQTETLENESKTLAPYNDVAELIDNKIHAAMLESINFLAREYDIRNPSEVAKFLRENLFLFDLLKEIPQKIRDYFGEDQKLSLRMSYDPDFPQSSDLWVAILTKLSVDKVFPLLEKFDEEWWFDNSERTHCKLNIKLEYI